MIGKVTPEWTVFGSLMFLDAELEDMNDPDGRTQPSLRSAHPPHGAGDRGTLATLRVNIDNLYDTRHFVNIRFGNLTPGPPRTVSTSLSLRF
ncbi:protein of unknown function [Nitrospina watsonii]|uniref:TonB-dependent receptor-like beta-barrel domain-containing protein n=1 Tax=Nitrospina watsonii TaxID=1323948 RepID=A0ABM9HBR8_9BACT|nr:protein of unknown function [Nitrospina watsonii]